MKKFQLLVAFALSVSGTSTFAQGINVDELRPVPDNVAKADNACNLVATEVLTGMRSQTMTLPAAIALCNSHPVKTACESTKSFIKENNKGEAPPDLTCR